jgi:hypothetical protein
MIGGNPVGRDLMLVLPQKRRGHVMPVLCQFVPEIGDSAFSPFGSSQVPVCQKWMDRTSKSKARLLVGFETISALVGGMRHPCLSRNPN